VVLGSGGGGDASLGARLLGMRSTGSVLANMHHVTCHRYFFRRMRLNAWHACVRALLCRYGAWIGSGGDASLGARLLGLRSSALAHIILLEIGLIVSF